MTSTRAYRGARSWNSAMSELRRGAGTQWNPKVVEAAVSALAVAPAEILAAEAQRRPSPAAVA